MNHIEALKRERDLLSKSNDELREEVKEMYSLRGKLENMRTAKEAAERSLEETKTRLVQESTRAQALVAVLNWIVGDHDRFNDYDQLIDKDGYPVTIYGAMVKDARAALASTNVNSDSPERRPVNCTIRTYFCDMLNCRHCKYSYPEKAVTNEQNQTPDAPAISAELLDLARDIRTRRIEGFATRHFAMLNRAADAILELATLKASKQTQVVAAQVTDEIVRQACSVYSISLGGKSLHSRSPHEYAMRAALEAVAPLLAQPAAREAEHVGVLTVSNWRGMENRAFDYTGNLPDGDYRLYTALPAQPAALYSALVSIDKICNDDSGERTDSDKVAEIDSIATHYVLT